MGGRPTAGSHGWQVCVVTQAPMLLEVEAILRAVSGALDPVTPLSRSLERAAGPDLLKRLQAMGEIPVGGAVVTPGGDLNATFLIHAVIQSRDEAPSPDTVRKALVNGLRRAGELGVASLALPALGVGAGALDAEASARLTVDTFRDHMGISPGPSRLYITVNDGYESEAFQRELDRAFPLAVFDHS